MRDLDWAQEARHLDPNLKEVLHQHFADCSTLADALLGQGSAKQGAPVLKAFDTLLNRGDSAAPERLWSPHYISSSSCVWPTSCFVELVIDNCATDRSLRPS